MCYKVGIKQLLKILNEKNLKEDQGSGNKEDSFLKESPSASWLCID